MLRIFLLAISSFVFINTLAQGTLDSPNRFALKLLREVYSPDKNVFVSPISVFESFGLVENGARGETQLEIANTLELPKDLYGKSVCFQEITLAADKLKSVSIANSFWFNHTISINQDFKDKSKYLFRCVFEQVDFAEDSYNVVNRINKYVIDKTSGKIDKVLKEDEIIGASMVIINTIYFKGYWQDSFLAEKTYIASFTKANGETSDVMFMSREGRYRIWNYENFRAIELPYRADSISMIAIRPLGTTSLDEVVMEVDSELLRSIIHSNPGTESIQLEIPKFRIKYEDDLIGSLTNMGIKKAFANPDFSGMGNVNDPITNVKHSSFFEIDEQGSEAAAATAVVAIRSMNVMRFDRPFLVFIVDKKSGLILFEGVINDPKLR